MTANNERQAPAWKTAKLEALLAGIKAKNERKRAERNARRWKEERDPVAYEKQKKDQRATYAARKGEAELRRAEAEAKVAQIKRHLVLKSLERDEADDALAQRPPDLLEDILAAVERRLEAA